MTVEELRKIADTERAAQKKYQHHVCVCIAAGCLSSGSDQVRDAIAQEVAEAGMKNEVQVKGVGCMGLCSAGPLVSIEADGKMFANVKPEDAAAIVGHLDAGTNGLTECPTDVPFFQRQKKIVLENSGQIDPERIEDYIAHDGYFALVRAITEMSPQDVIQEIIKSGLRGRGGAGYPTGLKWSTVAKTGEQEKYVVCNADEGDPGAFMDRAVLESDPHRVLEGMAIAAYAVGAQKGYIYVSREVRLQELIREYFTLADLIHIWKRMIGSGQIGGKAVGMLLARAILHKKNPELAEKLEAHDSFYVGSDVFYTFLVENNCWWERKQQTDPKTFLEGIDRTREKILAGEFPDYLVKRFSDMLKYFGQSPIIVRSSSLLEDNFGNAFAGKYESVFCASQGTLPERLAEFLDAVRLIYASAMSAEALIYRLKRGVLDRDEQMALLVQRVSGAPHGHYFFPQMAGVAFSYNSYAWNRRIDPEAGVMRIVFGLGTRAVDRADDDYTRVVALNAPELRPEANFDQVRRYTQRRVDLLDLAANRFHNAHFLDIAPLCDDIPLELFAVKDRALEKYYEERSRPAQNSWILTFDNLFSKTSFNQDIIGMLATLRETYQSHVDIEFTANFQPDGSHKICVLQCRPLQVTADDGLAAAQPRIAEQQIVLDARGGIVGHSRAIALDWLVFVVPQVYGQLAEKARYEAARLIGTICHHERLAEQRRIMLLGPGRWGTSTPALGVPVSFGEINTASVFCEIDSMHEGLVPDLSLGTHFFNEMVEMNILYMAYFGGRAGNHLDTGFLLGEPNRLGELVAGSHGLGIGNSRHRRHRAQGRRQTLSARRLARPARPALPRILKARARQAVALRLDDALVEHGVGDLAETGDIGANDVVARRTVVARRFFDLGVDRPHDVMQALVDLFARPGQGHVVLAHFQARGGNAAGVGRLARRVENSGLEEFFDALGRGRHVRAFGDHEAAVGEQGIGIAAVDLVLRRARKSGVALDAPRPLAGHELAVVFPRVFLDPPAAHVLQLEHELELVAIDALRIVDAAFRVGHRHHPRAELVELFHRVLRHVARTRDRAYLAGDAVLAALEHFLGEIHRAVAGRLGAHQGSTPVEALAGQHRREFAGELLVLAEQEADLAAADTDIAGRNVGMRPDMPEQLVHEGLTEAHHLEVALALRVEIGTALAAAHRQRRQRVLEDLLESEELEDRQIDARVEAQPALVGTDGAVALDAIATIDLHLALVVDPGDAEHDDAFGLDDALEDFRPLVFGMLVEARFERFKNLLHCLVELGLIGISRLDGCQDAGDIGHGHTSLKKTPGKRRSSPTPACADVTTRSVFSQSSAGHELGLL